MALMLSGYSPLSQESWNTEVAVRKTAAAEQGGGGEAQGGGMGLFEPSGLQVWEDAIYFVSGLILSIRCCERSWHMYTSENLNWGKMDVSLKVYGEPPA